MKIAALIVILVLFLSSFFFLNKSQDKGYFLFNQKFIEALDTNLDYTDPKAVFGFVFSKLDPEVVVYPSENYYYFEFLANGRAFHGAIGLFADIIDDDKIMLAYAERELENQTQENSYTIYLNASDDLGVEKINDFRYKVSHKGKDVVFNFNQLDIRQPSSLAVFEDEKFVAPVFDESGLLFYLIYNSKINRFYWILSEASKVSFSKIYNSTFVDRRTQFIFYSESGRNILVGVNKNNAASNNWYDGPFDQISYNYVKTGDIDIKFYLDRVYPQIKNSINAYGKLNGTNSRIAITPYSEYLEAAEVVEKVKDCEESRETMSGFYKCIIG